MAFKTWPSELTDGRREAAPVGVVADDRAVDEHERVDRADPPRLRPELVAQRERGLLVRHGKVDARRTPSAGAPRTAAASRPGATWNAR